MNTQTQHINEVIERTSRHVKGLADDDIITRSWARCVSDHGLDPSHTQPARVLEAARLREHQECKTACKTFQISGVISVQKLPPWVV